MSGRDELVIRGPWGRGHRTWVALLALVTLVGSVVVACAEGDGTGEAIDGTVTVTSAPDGPDATTTTAPASSSDPVRTTTVTTAATTNPTGTGTSASVSDPIAVDPGWARYEEAWFVWGVAPDDVLNARAGAGASERLVTTFAPGATGIRSFSETQRVGDAVWRPVEVPGGAAWVNARFLRPVGPASPVVEGTPGPAAPAAAGVADALRAGDPAAVAAWVGPAGLRVAPYASVGPDNVELTAAQLRDAAGDGTELLWGYTDGEGAPIRQTITSWFEGLSGRTALTSTTAIGHDVRLGAGNSIDTIDQVFPGASVVEYHFDGTSLFGDFDWTSVRLVFDVSGPAPVLLAIVEDSWTV